MQLTKRISFHTDKREYLVLFCVSARGEGDPAVTISGST